MRQRLSCTEHPRLSGALTAGAADDVPLLFELLAVRPGMTVADVGAGAGALTLVASNEVGDRGRVYATDDLAPKTVVELQALVAREHLTNVKVVQGAVAATNLTAEKMIVASDRRVIRRAEYFGLSQSHCVRKV